MINDVRQIKEEELLPLIEYFNKARFKRYTDVTKNTKGIWRLAVSAKTEGRLIVVGHNPTEETLNDKLLTVSEVKITFNPAAEPNLTFTGAVTLVPTDPRNTSDYGPINEKVIIIVNNWFKLIGLSDNDSILTFIELPEGSIIEPII